MWVGSLERRSKLLSQKGSPTIRTIPNSCSNTRFDSIFPRETQLESAIGYSIAMSCVMSNRLCLNVRGMVHHDHDEDVDEYLGSHHQQPSPTSPTSPITFGSNRSQWPTGREHFVKVGYRHEDRDSSDAIGLTAYEMDELRGMKMSL